ncbi:hypothetical protein LCI18_008597 [Fusarium solani-melongenae]|uniref:Uncharacterized protein n=1 Tax=Fusarium solani subsp. cucurbitae TaxID=2747967 RepID=A0ACD3Z953_FUSSC|nr:hypothetical protein LCI18_008597 [Fusarium solani-melongenae]
MANDDFNNHIIHNTPNYSRMQSCLQYAQKAQSKLGRHGWARLAQYAHNATELLPEAPYLVWGPEALRINAQVKKEFGNFKDVAGDFMRFVRDAKMAGYDARMALVTV